MLLTGPRAWQVAALDAQRPSPAWFAARDPVAVVLALCLALGCAAGVRTLLNPTRHTVFPVFVLGSAHWWGDQPLYARYDALDYFRYPPIFAVLITPLAALGPAVGGVAWTWLSLLTYLAGLWHFRRWVLPPHWSRGREAVYLAAAMLGAVRGLWNGQSNALAVGLLLLGGAELARRHDWRAALALGAAVWLKLTPLPAVLLLVALWPRRLAGRLTVVLVVLALVPFLTRPPAVVLGHHADWLRHLLDSADGRWPGFRDAWTAWLVCLHPAAGEETFPLRQPTEAWYRLLQVGTGVLTLAWCLWQRRRAGATARLVPVTLAAGCTWLMLFGPAVEHAAYAFLAPFLAAALADGWDRPGGRGLLLAAAVLVLVLGWGSLTRPLLAWTSLPHAILPLGSALFAVRLFSRAGEDGEREAHSAGREEEERRSPHPALRAPRSSLPVQPMMSPRWRR